MLKSSRLIILYLHFGFLPRGSTLRSFKTLLRVLRERNILKIAQVAQSSVSRTGIQPRASRSLRSLTVGRKTYPCIIIVTAKAVSLFTLRELFYQLQIPSIGQTRKLATLVAFYLPIWCHHQGCHIYPIPTEAISLLDPDHSPIPICPVARTQWSSKPPRTWVYRA